MLYTDPLFLALFALVCGICRMLRPWPAIKEWFLILFSFFVIATWGYFDLVLFLVVLAFNYGVVRAMAQADARRDPLSQTRGKTLLVVAITINLATLALFKYADFLGGTFGAVSGWKFPAFPLGIPLAISFYIFHLISYLMDVHRGKVQVATLRQYFFYLSFFPHVVAGPIVRAWQLVPQIGHQRRIRTDLTMGFHFLVTGFFLKMVMANNIARGIDQAWGGETMAQLSTLDRWALAFLYYCQIYGDFAGYSLMALGMARLLGYRLPANFRSPMIARTLQEFWQRWHITLSRWLRDYLYFSLGGNRVSAARLSLNLLVTMLLGGLWHGASWSFVVWGGMHGVGLIVERWIHLRQWRGVWSWTAGLLLTQMWVTCAWVFFRVQDLPSALHFLWHMVPFTTPHLLSLNHAFLMILICALPVVGHNLAPRLLKYIPRRKLGAVLGFMTAVTLVLNVIILSPNAVFIYFKF